MLQTASTEILHLIWSHGKSSYVWTDEWNITFTVSDSVQECLVFHDITLSMCVSVLDLNECTAKPGVCKNGRCENTIGSYRCKCDQGFVANPTQTECIGTHLVSVHVSCYCFMLFFCWATQANNFSSLLSLTDPWLSVTVKDSSKELSSSLPPLSKYK